MYVFGVDFPIMEVLFFFGFLLLITLIVIWLEIRKLRELILTEKVKIKSKKRR